jgi:hypothetical protein
MQFVETIKWRTGDDIKKLLVTSKLKRGFTQNIEKSDGI